MSYHLAIPVLISFVLSLLMGPVVIPFLRKLKMGQTERTDGVQSHLKKAGTPTMGGVIILGSVIITSLFYVKDYPNIIPILFLTIGFGPVSYTHLYRTDAPLDMRMDQRQKMTAKDIVNGYSESDLYRVIRDYGEDRFAKNIAKHIVIARGKGPIETTGQLNEIIRQAIPMKIQKTSGHPSKRTYQAIRIELNRELEVLRDTLDDMIELLNPGGRICIITFHSLEDRIVKSAVSYTHLDVYKRQGLTRGNTVRFRMQRNLRQASICRTMQR